MKVDLFEDTADQRLDGRFLLDCAASSLIITSITMATPAKHLQLVIMRKSIKQPLKEAHREVHCIPVLDVL